MYISCVFALLCQKSAIIKFADSQTALFSENFSAEDAVRLTPYKSDNLKFTKIMPFWAYLVLMVLAFQIRLQVEVNYFLSAWKHKFPFGNIVSQKRIYIKIFLAKIVENFCFLLISLDIAAFQNWCEKWANLCYYKNKKERRKNGNQTNT